jgi:hypothetical protein
LPVWDKPRIGVHIRQVEILDKIGGGDACKIKELLIESLIGRKGAEVKIDEISREKAWSSETCRQPLTIRRALCKRSPMHRAITRLQRSIWVRLDRGLARL